MGPHILFVDDEAPIRELLSLFFRKKGWKVTTAVSVAEAKEIGSQASYTLAILDVNLAGENGLDLLSFFKKQYPELPILIFTGLRGEGLLEKAMANGASGFLRKTESLNDLYTEACRYLPKG